MVGEIKNTPPDNRQGVHSLMVWGIICPRPIDAYYIGCA